MLMLLSDSSWTTFFSLAISPLGTALQSNRGQVYPNKNILECLPKGLNCVTSGEKNYDLKEKFKAFVHQEKRTSVFSFLTLVTTPFSACFPSATFENNLDNHR